MATAKTTDTAKQITYLAGALKAPRITETAARLADHARDAGWSFEDYLTAVLEREVSARNASGAQLRIKAAGFSARKTQRTTWCCSARREQGRRTSRPRWGSSPPGMVTGC